MPMSECHPPPKSIFVMARRSAEDYAVSQCGRGELISTNARSSEFTTQATWSWSGALHRTYKATGKQTYTISRRRDC
jgi:hypothetical protein